MAAWLVLALVATGCASATVRQRQPEARDDGVQATGVIQGRRVAISDGSPETNLVDCDPGIPPDHDVCWIARTIDGLTVAFVIENPDALAADQVIEVRADSCVTCDEVRDQAIVDLRVGGVDTRGTSGRLDVAQVGARYAAGFDVTFRNGDRLMGDFNIRQLRPDEL